MTYDGYLASRFQVLSGSTAAAIAVVAFVWSPHVFMPLTFDAKFLVFRPLSPGPNSVFDTWFCLPFRRLIPLAVAHALMDGTTVVIGALLPLLRA